MSGTEHCEEMMSLSKTGKRKRELPAPAGYALWEYFCDDAYYGLWCVRRNGETCFGYGYHVQHVEEARNLCDELNKLTKALIKIAETVDTSQCCSDGNEAIAVWAMDALHNANVQRSAGAAPNPVE